MLAIPKYGWTHIDIGNFSERASYLTDIPKHCLKNMIIALENNIDFCVDFDAEGWEFKVISDDFNTYIINNKEKIQLHVEDININKLALEIYNDISNNLNDWSLWNCEDDTEGNEEYKIELYELLEKLKNFIK